jgi:tRNA(His) guanylyltransferase
LSTTHKEAYQIVERTAIGDRFKRYEQVTDFALSRRTPVIGRIDGRAFHTLTRNMQKPFDWDFASAMIETAKAVCMEIQGCKLAYVQSDEINVLIIDYDTIQTEAWFDYRLQKMASIAASVASVQFTGSIRKKWLDRCGHFDARFFNVPSNDVCNYFVWRQRDAERNSLQSLAQATFPHKQLQGLNSSELQEKLFTEKGINYNDIDPVQKRGAFIVKQMEWVYQGAPIFSQERDAIEKFLPEFQLATTT